MNFLKLIGGSSLQEGVTRAVKEADGGEMCNPEAAAGREG